MARESIGQILVSQGALGVEQLQPVLDAMRKSGRTRFGHQAVAMGLISSEDLAKALAKQFQLQHVPLDRVQKLNVPRATLELLPASMVRERLVVPTFFDAQARVLSLLVQDPTDLVPLKTAQELTGATRLRLFVAATEAIEALVGQVLPQERDPSGDRAGAPKELAEVLQRLRQRRHLVVETDLQRLAALRQLERLEGTNAELVSDPGQVEPLLKQGGLSCIFHRIGLGGEVEAYLPRWRQVAPEVRVVPVSGFGPSQLSTVPTRSSRDFLLRVIEFTLLSGETRNMKARARVRRMVRLAQQIGAELALPGAELDTLLIGALFSQVGELTVLGGIVGDDTFERRDAHRFEVALAVLEPLNPPYRIRPIFDGLQRRLARPNELGDDLLVEVLFTLNALVHHPDGSRDVKALDDLSGQTHDPAILHTVGTVLRREHLLGRLAGEGGDRTADATVLLAESEAAVITALEARLGQAGYEVIIAGDGEEALERARAVRPAAVVAGHRLRKRDGFSLLVELKRSEDTKDIPVVLLVDENQGSLVSRGLDLGAEDVLAKPLNIYVLMSRLRRSIGAAAAPTQAGIVGRLADLSLPDLLQTLYLGGKTAEIRVTGPTGRGQLHLADGQLVYAALGTHLGEEALYEMVFVQDGLFEVRFGVSSRDVNINGTTDGLLLEALRRLDEARAQRED